MSKARKTWAEKLADDKGLPKVVRIEGTMSRKWGEGTFVVPAPVEVDALMIKVPKGRLATIDTLRSRLARDHKVTIACPLTTGIFSWIAAHAAAEAEQAGRKRVTPYWRILKAKGELNPKYPGGIAALTTRLNDEGHQVAQRGKRWFVVDFEKKLVAL